MELAKPLSCSLLEKGDNKANIIGQDFLYKFPNSLRILISLISLIVAYANLGNILAQKGLKDEARKAYLQSLQHRPNMADTHYNL